MIYAGVGLALFSMLTVSSIYVLRWTRPDLPRRFAHLAIWLFGVLDGYDGPDCCRFVEAAVGVALFVN